MCIKPLPGSVYSLGCWWRVCTSCIYGLPLQWWEMSAACVPVTLAYSVIKRVIQRGSKRKNIR